MKGNLTRHEGDGDQATGAEVIASDGLFGALLANMPPVVQQAITDEIGASGVAAMGTMAAIRPNKDGLITARSFGELSGYEMVRVSHEAAAARSKLTPAVAEGMLKAMTEKASAEGIELSAADKTEIYFLGLVTNLAANANFFSPVNGDVGSIDLKDLEIFIKPEGILGESMRLLGNLVESQGLSENEALLALSNILKTYADRIEREAPDDLMLSTTDGAQRDVSKQEYARMIRRVLEQIRELCEDGKMNVGPPKVVDLSLLGEAGVEPRLALPVADVSAEVGAVIEMQTNRSLMQEFLATETMQNYFLKPEVWDFRSGDRVYSTMFPVINPGVDGWLKQQLEDFSEGTIESPEALIAVLDSHIDRMNSRGDTLEVRDRLGAVHTFCYTNQIPTSRVTNDRWLAEGRCSKLGRFENIDTDKDFESATPVVEKLIDFRNYLKQFFHLKSVEQSAESEIY